MNLPVSFSFSLVRLQSLPLSSPPGTRRCGAFGEHSDFKLEFFRLSFDLSLSLSLFFNLPPPLFLLSSTSSSSSHIAFFPTSSPFSPFLSFHRLLGRFSVLRSQDDRRWVTEMRQTTRIARPCELSRYYAFRRNNVFFRCTTFSCVPLPSDRA